MTPLALFMADLGAAQDALLGYLLYFVAAAEEKNFSRAAERLGVTQPAVSTQIGKLEEKLAVRLFERGNKEVALTAAGLELLNGAQGALQCLRTATESARAVERDKRGQLVIGHHAPADHTVLRSLIPLFEGAHPNVKLTFHHNSNCRELIEQLRQKKLDVALAWLPFPTQGLEVHELVTMPLDVVIPVGHLLTRVRRVTFHDLSGVPLILPERALHPDLRDKLDRRFREAGSKLELAYELGSSLGLVSFVAMAVGCTFLPNNVRHIRTPGVVRRPLDEPDMGVTMAIAIRPDCQNLSRAFFEYARSQRYASASVPAETAYTRTRKRFSAAALPKTTSGRSCRKS